MSEEDIHLKPLLEAMREEEEEAGVGWAHR